jgi:hypothetical protein
MFLHVGADVVVSLKQVVGIFDLRSAKGAATREFMKMMHHNRQVTDIAGKDAKSLVVTDTAIYLSPISSLTLKKRADFLNSSVILDFSH